MNLRGSKAVTLKLRSFFWLALPVVLFAGCGEQEQISTYKVKKRADWRPRFAIEQPEPVEELVYDTPDGWRPADKVMFAAVSLVAIDGDQRAKITVSPLPADKAAVVPNVKRWREQQLRLPPISPAEISDLTQEVKVGDQTAKFFELVGPETDGHSETILAAMLPAGQRVLIVKLRADSKFAQREKENFLSFLRSLHYQKSN